MDFLIDKTINALKQRLQENNGVIRIQSPEGNLSYGTCRFFDHPQYGGESYLYGLNEIFEQTYEEPSDGFLKIGYFYQDNIVIDLKAFNAGERNYLLVKGYLDQFYEARKLNMNFEIWLDRFIICQGALFWNWSI